MTNDNKKWKVDVIVSRTQKGTLIATISARCSLSVDSEHENYKHYDCREIGTYINDNIKEQLWSIATKEFAKFLTKNYSKYIGTKNECRFEDGHPRQFNFGKSFIKSVGDEALINSVDFDEAWAIFNRTQEQKDVDNDE